MLTEALTLSSGIDAVEKPRKRDSLTDVLDPADPGQGPLHAEAETRVGDAAVFSQVNVPFIRLARKIVLFEPLLEEGEIVNALSSADNLAVTFRGQNIHAERQVRPLRVGLHVKSLDLHRKMSDTHRRIKDLRYQCLFRGSEIGSPGHRGPLFLEKPKSLFIGYSRKRLFDSL
jgi:hypothetical protein